MLGASDALLESAHDWMPPVTVEKHRRLTAQLEDVLGPASFAAARTAGRRLTIDRVLTEAQELSGKLGTRGPTKKRTSSYGTPQLTRREGDVLRLVAAGNTDREIAEALSISRRTVTTHVSHLLTKLDVNSRVGATAWAVRHQLA